MSIPAYKIIQEYVEEKEEEIVDKLRDMIRDMLDEIYDPVEIACTLMPSEQDIRMMYDTAIDEANLPF